MVQAELMGLGVTSSGCTYPIGHNKFDFSDLITSKDYTWKEETRGYTYTMNVCGASNHEGCKEKMSGSICQLRSDDGQIVAKLGSWDEMFPVYSLINAVDPGGGVMAQFNNGQPACRGIVDRTTQVRFVCRDTDPFIENVQEMDETNLCLFIITIPTRTACPGYVSPRKLPHTLSTSWTFLICLFILTPVYVVGGYMYKSTRVGLSGLDALPNVEFWRMLPGLVWDGIRYSTGFIRCQTAALVQKAAGKSNFDSDL